MSMKQIFEPIVAATVLMTSLAACTIDDSINGDDVIYMLPEKNNITLTAGQQQMRDNNNEFACRLFPPSPSSKMIPAASSCRPSA